MFYNSDQAIIPDELKEKWILAILEWAKDHILPAILIVCILIVLFIIGWKIWVWIKDKITNRPPHATYNQKVSESRNQRITTGTAPRVDSKYSNKYLPKDLEQLVGDFKKGKGAERFRYCVVYQDEKMLEHYARLFYEKVTACGSLRHLGWIYYKKPDESNQPPGIKYCLFKQLCIYTEGERYNDPDKRYRAVCEFFQKPGSNVLLVISDKHNIDIDDDELKQMTSMEGLSIVMFSKKEMDGFDILQLDKKGGGK